MKSESFCWTARAPVNHWLGRRLSVRLFLETRLSPVKLKRLPECMCACGHWVAEHSGRRKALHSSQPDGPQPRKIHRRTETYCTWRHTWKITTTEGSGCPHTENHNCEAKPKSEHVFYCGLTAWMWINLVCFQEIIQLKVKILILYSSSSCMTISSAGPKNRRLAESQRFSILWNWMVSRSGHCQELKNRKTQ